MGQSGAGENPMQATVITKVAGPVRGPHILQVHNASITTKSGLWGFCVTDMFQFCPEEGMVIALAVFRRGGQRRHGFPSVEAP
jgi:hypothetical protein